MPPVSVPVDSIVAVYGVAAVAFCVLALAVGARWDRRRPPARVETSSLPEGLRHAPAQFSLTNGCAASLLYPDGRGHLTVEGTTRGGHDVDLSKKVTDPLQLRGPFFYIRDADAGMWSTGFEPMRNVGADYAAMQPAHDCAVISHTMGGIRSDAALRLAEEEPLEFWTLTLVNTEARPRRLTVASYRELGVHELGAYARDPDFNAVHVETWFIARLQGLFMRNRLLRRHGRMSPEIMFHAVRLAPGAALIGYEDSRTRFIGHDGLRDPHGLNPDRPRRPDDEGSLYTFDPAASLSVAVDLPAHGTCELFFVTGWGRDEAHAAEIVAHHLRVARPSAISPNRRQISDGRTR